ncbi:MAG: hypothetical protein ACRDWT_09610 [Jatrophihabitantaceae bacterium]
MLAAWRRRGERSSLGRRHRNGIATATAALTLLALAPLAYFAPSAAADVPSVLPPVQQRTSTGVTADALPTAQMNGVAWSQAIAGNNVWVGGSFSAARPAGSPLGSNEVTRNNLLVYNINTGALVSSIAPSFNAQVKVVTVSPDGSRVYVGGQFTSVNGVTRNRIAAFDASTGALINSFAPSVDSVVNAIVATNATVYVGGAFSKSSSVARTRLAAFTAGTGALLSWNPTADDGVQSMVLTPDGSKMIVAGAFNSIGGATYHGLAALDPATGAPLPWAATNVVQDSSPGAVVSSLSTDGTFIYGTAWAYGSPSATLEGSFSADPDSGAINWIENCWGDEYDIFAMNGVAYNAGHMHACYTLGGWHDTNPRTIRHSLAFTSQPGGTLGHDNEGNPDSSTTDFYGQPAPSIVDWFPDFTAGTYTGQSQATWTVTGNGQYLVEGGEFPKVNNQAQQGLVRFAVPSIAPKKQGPQLSGASWAASGVARSSTSVRLSWQSNWDRDDLNLAYSVIRDG